MEKDILKQQRKRLITLTPVTRHCKICFKEITDHSLFNSFNKESRLCEKCFQELKAKFIKFKIGSIDCLSIYEYDETIKNLIYKFKGCYDYELKDVFLNRYKTYLQTVYKNYIAIPVPSSKIDDMKRGFNHVEEIFKTLGLEMAYVLEKNKNEKQSSKSKKDRLKVDSVLIGKNLEQIKNKKVLIVDDVYTTGATMNKAISIIEKAFPKVMKVLVVAKTIDLNKRK